MNDADPFAARGTNSVPPGIHDSDLFAATPRSAPTVPTSASGARSAPLLSAAGGTMTARTGTSGKSMKTPWYLTWAGIVGLVVALLLAIGLGVGLGVGLGTRDGGDSKSNAVQGAGSGGAMSTVTTQSILSSVVTANPSTTLVEVSVDNTASASLATFTSYIGGSTVLISAPVSIATRTGAAPIVTVSETLAPSTRVQTVFATTFASTQTVTVTLPGGATRTSTEVVTVERTVTAQALGRAARR
ncbi:hypothetical protein JCM10908_001471 [Rhodotorula pacifica]|uniref:uncharacterized protein n=1 Tax=Rhodotorula pacifica TaxID=1495444 RepID=UPI00317451CF